MRHLAVYHFVTAAAFHRADSRSTVRVGAGIRPAALGGYHAGRQEQADARST